MLVIKKVIWSRKLKTFKAQIAAFKVASRHYVNLTAGNWTYRRIYHTYPGMVLIKYDKILDEVTRLYDRGMNAYKNGELKSALKCIDEGIITLDNQIDILNISIAILKNIS